MTLPALDAATQHTRNACQTLWDATQKEPADKRVSLFLAPSLRAAQDLLEHLEACRETLRQQPEEGR